VKGYLHFNVANQWPDFTLANLVIEADSGALQLQKVATGFVRSGAFIAGPFKVGPDADPWFRVRATTSQLLPHEHVELYTFASDTIGPTPPPLTAHLPFVEPGWRQAPRDLADILVSETSASAQTLWIGGVLRGAGDTTPKVYQIRGDYGRATPIDFLPAAYGREAAARDRLERLLALDGSALEELERAIADLPRLFDPAAVPAGEFPSWLAWLSTWLDFTLLDRWSEADARALLASAFELYGWRGTIEGLRRYLEIYAGVTARITEPAATTALWSLGTTSTLGFTTRLASAAAQGAVLDSSATLDASHLSRGDDFGAALFEDIAHRFCVEIYCADLVRPGALRDVRETLEREKPAHTVYSLRVIEPRMRVGVQARVGVDTIVGQGPAFAQIGVPLGTGTLGGEAAPCDRPTEC
jgi:phage tail-like protein